MEKKIMLFDNSPYMKAWGEVDKNGDITTFVRTGEAAAVLPYHFQYQEEDYTVLLLEQERPEIHKTILKTIGGYLKSGESPEDCVIRNLKDKVGIKASAEKLEKIGKTVGYPTVDIPITLFVLSEWELVASAAKGCNLKEVSLDDAVKLALENKFGDDCSKEAVFRLLASFSHPITAVKK